MWQAGSYALWVGGWEVGDQRPEGPGVEFRNMNQTSVLMLRPLQFLQWVRSKMQFDVDVSPPAIV